MVHIGNDWDAKLSDQWEMPYYKKLRAFLAQEYKTQTVYPDMHHIFAALQKTSFADTKVVILGQDPYHGPRQAHGLCFSVQKGVEPPPSLKNIFKELQDDVGITLPSHGDLSGWAAQGVLLLNAVLTVRAGQAASHAKKGWETLTDHIITLLGQRQEPMVFLLWGNFARSKKALIQNKNHLILETVHPSPLSAFSGFFGCRHFSKANTFLTQNGMTPIDWSEVK